MKRSIQPFVFCLTGFFLLCIPVSRADQEQFPNLPETPTAERFKLTDRVWPDRAGEADICVWADDKLAAISFTIDDNCAPNVDWWMATAAKHGFKVTWFLITDRVSGDNPFDGTWAEYRKVLDAGHDLQSHTALHLHTELPQWKDIETEYRDSQKQIEENLPGHLCEFIAYPGGTNKALNDRVLAAKYYAAARGVSGGYNPPSKTDYFSIRSAGSLTTAESVASLSRLFDSSDLRYFRGWAVQLSHWVKDYSAMQPLLDFFDAHQADLWGGTFGNVAKYGQERDTATLKVTESSEKRITFTLTDRMMDSRFDYPLTIKVRLPVEWEDVQAAQSEQVIAVDVIEHDGARFALVHAVPDRGVVVLEPTSI